MAGEGVVARPAESRVSTGNPSLDTMLEGGLVAHRPYLIVGPSGTGKTTLALQFLCEGARRNERVLLVTLEEPPNEAHVNHRGLEPTLSRVEVFDAIPDIMRYERTPFKDIASVRMAVPFSQVPKRIRQSPELASVEVTITALEQMLRTEVIRRGYTRLVIDSLTALQYFCMKGFDPVAGAQSFLRFLSDLRVTTLLTVEAPLEDVETPERMLARGEIRLFRWELDGQTVRAIGVEKFRGSSHDVRLHPYRIGPPGIDINLDVTISRDTRQIIEPLVRRPPPPVAAAPVAPLVTPVTPLIDEVRDLILLGADVAPARSEISAALAATTEGLPDQAQAHLSRVSSMVMVLVDRLSRTPGPPAQSDPTAVAALQRVLARADSVRTGVPPTSLPPPAVLQVQLGALLSLLPPPAPPAAGVLPPPPPPEIPPPTPTAVVPPPAPTSVPEPVPQEAPVAAVPSPVPVEGHEPPAAVVAPEAVPNEAPASAQPSSPSEVPSTTIVAPAAPPPPTPPEVAPAPIEATAPPAEPAGGPRPRAGRGLPPPPKPRSPMVGGRVAKPTSSSQARPGTAKAGPPPLPSTAVPEWPSTPSPAPRAAAATRPAQRAAEIPVPAPEGPTKVVAPSGAKKRRKGAGAAIAKRPTAHPRATTPKEAVDKPSPPPQPVTMVVPPPPHPAAPVTPPELATPAPPRRRAARKRKAPPVVSVTVEPTPPASGDPDADEKEPDDPDRPNPPEA